MGHLHRLNSEMEDQQGARPTKGFSSLHQSILDFILYVFVEWSMFPKVNLKRALRRRQGMHSYIL